jgi:hypothetical protein
MEPPVALHVTPGLSFVTSAESWMLVPAIIVAGAPSTATLGLWPAPTSTDTVAAAGLLGNGLFGSDAEKVNESGP